MKKNIPNQILITFILFSLTNSVYANSGFTENKGQWNEQALFRANLPSGNVFLIHDGFVFTFYDSEALHKSIDKPTPENKKAVKIHTYKVTFKNSSTTNVITNNLCQGYSNFFIGKDQSKWKSKVNSYKEIIYENLYPKIDLKIYSDHDNFKYDLILHPGAQLSDIVMHEEGVDNIYKRGKDLIFQTVIGEVKEQIPLAFVMDGKNKIEIECEYSLSGHDISFIADTKKIAHKDFIIDPSLLFSTYANSSGNAYGCNGTYDSNGNLFGSSVVYSSGYPVTIGAYDLTYNNYDLGIEKFDVSSSTLLWATYLGGSADESMGGMLCNASDELFIYGSTTSLDFPVGATSVLSSSQGSQDIFVSRLSTDGSQLLASTYIGGSDNDGASNNISWFYSYPSGDLFFDNSGNVVIACCTNSTNIPIVGGFQSSNHGLYDGCVFKLNSSLNAILYSTYIGGADDDNVTAISIDSIGDIVITGATQSIDFPITVGSYQPLKSPNSDADAYVAVINSSGSSLLYSTYFGQANTFESGCCIGINSTGKICVSGVSEGVIPFTAGAFTNQSVGNFIAVFEPNLSALQKCNAFGNGSNSVCVVPFAFHIDECDNFLTAGFLASTLGVQMPVTSNAIQGTSLLLQGLYMYEFNSNLDTLVYASYLNSGSSDHSHGGASHFDNNNNLYFSLCTDGVFPVTSPTYASNSTPVYYETVSLKFGFDQCTSLMPLVSFTSSQEKVCAGTCINFINTTTNATSFIWDFPGAIPSTSTDPNPQMICYNTPGYFDVTLTALSSAGTATQTQNSLIVVNQPLQVLLNQTGDTLYVNGPGFVSFDWYFNGTLVQSGTQSYYIATQSGNYSVTAIDVHDCASEYSLSSVIASVNDELASANGVDIYPNPSTGTFVIELDNKNEWKRFVLTDITGKILIDEKIKSHKIVIDKQKINLSSSLYFCTIQSETKNVVSKILVE